MITVRKIVCVAALLCIASTGLAQRSSELSDDFPDAHTMAVQDKVDSLFDAGDFERAFFIYINELAPLGDKYAQYMVGYMYQTGLGVVEDPIAAAAWYQLAAERDTREFVVVRDRILHVMDQDDADRSRVLYRELRLRYCDLAVLFASIKRDLAELQERTGSRLGDRSSPVTVVGSRSGRFREGSNYYSSIEKELKARIRLLKEVSGFDDLDGDPNRINIRDLERRVLQKIESESS